MAALAANSNVDPAVQNKAQVILRGVKSAVVILGEGSAAKALKDNLPANVTAQQMAECSVEK